MSAAAILAAAIAGLVAHGALAAAYGEVDSGSAGAGPWPGALAAATHAHLPARDLPGGGSSAPVAFAPGAVAANATHMFVADAAAGQIRIFDANVVAAAGSPQPPLRQAGAYPVEGSPYGVAVNGTGHLFVSDPAAGRVFVLGPGGSPAGELLPAAGNGGPAGPMRWPAGVAAGPDGRVYVAERNAGRVLVFDGGGAQIGAIGQGGAGRLLAPSDVAVNGTGHVLVADTAANAVQAFGAGGAHAGTIAVPPLGGAAGTPHGVAAFGGGLYVASLLQGAVHVHNGSGWSAQPARLQYAPAAPAAAALQPRPLSVAAGPGGLLLVADGANARAALFAPNGTLRAGVAGPGAGASAGPGGAPPLLPVDAAAAAAGAAAGAGAGALYVSDAGSGGVVAYSFDPASGSYERLWMSGAGARGGLSGPPAGIAVDGSGRVLVAHRGGPGTDASIRILSPRDGSPAGALPVGGPGARPAGIAVGPSGLVAVADPAAAAVRLIAANGTQAGLIGGLDDPADVAFLSDGAVVVAERGSHEVRAFSVGAGGASEGGPPLYGGPEGTAVASFGLGPGGVFLPEAVAVDSGDRIMVADSGGPAHGRRVQVFDYAGRLVSGFDAAGGPAAGPAQNRSGQAGPAQNRSGQAGPAAGMPYSPAGLGVAPDGTVLVADPAAVPPRPGAVRAFGPLDSQAPRAASFGMAGGAPGHAPLAAGVQLGPYSLVAANVTFSEPVVVRPPPMARGGQGQLPAGAGGAVAAQPPSLALGLATNRSSAATSDEFCGGASAGGAGRALYASGSGTASLLFSYTVLEGDRAAAVDYESTDSIDARGSSITDAAGNRAVLSMPAAPGAPGSFSASARVPVNGSAGTFLDAGLLTANASSAGARAAGLAACDFNVGLASSGAAGPFLRLAAVEVPASASAAASQPGQGGGRAAGMPELAWQALRGAHDSGRGPAVYVTTLRDAALATPAGPSPSSSAAGYALDEGLLVVASASSAPSLSARNDSLYRLVPDDAHLAYALARAWGPEIDALFPIIQADMYGEPAPSRAGAAPLEHGLYGLMLGHLRDTGIVVGGVEAGHLNYDRTKRAEFNFTSPHAGWAADAARLELELALLRGQVGADRVAVVYLGSAAEYVRLAEHAASLPGLSGVRWLAAGDVARSPLVEGSAAAASLAASTGLDALSFDTATAPGAAAAAAAAPASAAAAGRVDRAVGPALDEAVLAYSSYDAVQVLGRAAAAAAAAAAAEEAAAAAGPQAGQDGGPPPPPPPPPPGAQAVAQHMDAAALGHSGALGALRLDVAGDLGLPRTYGVWGINGDTGKWERASLEHGIEVCSVGIARQVLDFGTVSARSASAAARQTLVNTGSLDLAWVAIEAGDWRVLDGSGAVLSTLPAHLTEYVDLSARAQSAAAARFAPLPDDPARAAIVARGLEPIGEADVLLRLNLRPVQSLDGGDLSQTMSYLASCG